MDQIAFEVLEGFFFMLGCWLDSVGDVTRWPKLRWPHEARQ